MLDFCKEVPFRMFCDDVDENYVSSAFCKKKRQAWYIEK